MGFKDIIEFDTSTMKNQVQTPEDQHLHYNINKRIKQGSFDIFHDISEMLPLYN